MRIRTVLLLSCHGDVGFFRLVVVVVVVVLFSIGGKKQQPAKTAERKKKWRKKFVCRPKMKEKSSSKVN